MKNGENYYLSLCHRVKELAEPDSSLYSSVLPMPEAKHFEIVCNFSSMPTLDPTANLVSNTLRIHPESNCLALPLPQSWLQPLFLLDWIIKNSPLTDNPSIYLNIGDREADHITSSAQSPPMVFRVPQNRRPSEQ